MMVGENVGAGLVDPILDNQNMLTEIEIIKSAMGIGALWSSNDQGTDDAITTLHARVRVPKMCAGVIRREAVTERGMRGNWTLSYVRNTVHVGCLLLVQTMPVNCGAVAQQIVLDINHNLVTLAYLNGRTRHHAIHNGYATLQAIPKDAVRPLTVRQIEGTVKAGLREGLIPFNHKGVVASHGWCIHLTIPHTWMLSIPFRRPDIFRNIQIVQLLDSGRCQRSTDWTTTVSVYAPRWTLRINGTTIALVAVYGNISIVQAIALQERAVLVIMPRLPHRIQGIVVLTMCAHALATAAAGCFAPLGTL